MTAPLSAVKKRLGCLQATGDERELGHLRLQVASVQERLCFVKDTLLKAAAGQNAVTEASDRVHGYLDACHAPRAHAFRG